MSNPIYRLALPIEEVTGLLHLLISSPLATSATLIKVRKKLTLLRLKHDAGLASPAYETTGAQEAKELTVANLGGNSEEDMRQYLLEHGTEEEKEAVQACMVQEMEDGTQHSYKEWIKP